MTGRTGDITATEAEGLAGLPLPPLASPSYRLHRAAKGSSETVRRQGPQVPPRSIAVILVMALI
jgi:hypothetical protein